MITIEELDEALEWDESGNIAFDDDEYENRFCSRVTLILYCGWS